MNLKHLRNKKIRSGSFVWVEHSKGLSFILIKSICELTMWGSIEEEKEIFWVPGSIEGRSWRAQNKECPKDDNNGLWLTMMPDS